MKNTVLFLLIGSALTLFSCSTKETEQVGTTDNLYDIEILNGEKWTVDNAMMEHIHSMDEDVRHLSNSNDKSYDELGRKLKENLELLTSSCTMTGQGHDELHKWLLPFIDLVDDLNAAESGTDKSSIFESIELSMNEFNAYFK